MHEIPAWNVYTIPQKGIPDVLFANHLRITRINEAFLPPADVVAADYVNNGGHMTFPDVYGSDPLDGQLALQQQQEEYFTANYLSFEGILYSLVNGQEDVFRDALLTFIDITNRLS